MSKIVKIKGGIGNQLFQYAFFKFLSSRGFEVELDVSWYHQVKISNSLTKRELYLNKILNNFPKISNHKTSIKDKILSYKSEKLQSYFAKKDIFYTVHKIVGSKHILVKSAYKSLNTVMMIFSYQISLNYF